MQGLNPLGLDLRVVQYLGFVGPTKGLGEFSLLGTMCVCGFAF